MRSGSSPSSGMATLAPRTPACSTWLTTRMLLRTRAPLARALPLLGMTSGGRCMPRCEGPE
eukprot:14714521-Alexandrium_andersonii.AAC.1